MKPIPKHFNRHSYNETIPNPTTDNSIYKRSLTPELVNKSDGKMSSSKFPSSISSPNLAKQDSGSSSTGSSSRYNHDLINFSEDYARSWEEREKRIEERKMSGSRGSSGSSSANGEIRTPKTKKRTLQLPNAPNREIKPSTILCLGDRDLVVIDKHDIKEAVKNESQVIIVDPPALPTTPADGEQQHLDLGDILGGEWPELAGGAASLLNADKKSGSVSSTNGFKTLERNKSANIASHFSSNKPRRTGYDNGFESNTLKKSEFELQNFQKHRTVS